MALTELGTEFLESFLEGFQYNPAFGGLGFTGLSTAPFKYLRIAGTRDGVAFELAETKTLVWVPDNGGFPHSFTIDITGYSNITINKLNIYTEFNGGVSDLMCEITLANASFSQSGVYTVQSFTKSFTQEVTMKVKVKATGYKGSKGGKK